MAEFDFTLTARPALGGHTREIGENRIAERDDLALVSVAIPQGGEADLAQALRSGWDIALPEASQSSAMGEMRALRTAPDQILMVFPHRNPDAADLIGGTLSGAGYVTDQTDVWVALEITGPGTLAALERLCPLDAKSFPEGGTARTQMEHMAAILLRLGPDHFFLLSARSSAQSFLHAVETSFRYVISEPSL